MTLPIDWMKEFPLLCQMSEHATSLMLKSSLIINRTQEYLLFGFGQRPEHFLLLLDGVIRVQQISENGREIVLYRVFPGESCTLTTACLMGNERYQAEGVAETDIRGVAIPRQLFDDLVATSREFRQFIFSGFGWRVTKLLRVIEEVTFSRIEARLSQKLLELADTEGRVAITHQSLANELGSAREVISRQITEFQRRGWIRTSRGFVEITDRIRLSILAGQT